VTPKTNRQVVERYVEALIARDLDLQAEICAQDVVVEYPQSGERPLYRHWFCQISGRQDLAGDVAHRVALGQNREDD